MEMCDGQPESETCHPLESFKNMVKFKWLVFLMGIHGICLISALSDSGD